MSWKFRLRKIDTILWNLRAPERERLKFKKICVDGFDGFANPSKSGNIQKFSLKLKDHLNKIWIVLKVSTIVISESCFWQYV
jgi:hypothetical protein